MRWGRFREIVLAWMVLGMALYIWSMIPAHAEGTKKPSPEPAKPSPCTLEIKHEPPVKSWFEGIWIDWAGPTRSIT